MERCFGNKFSVKILPVLKDNYCYLIQCLTTKQIAAVDVSETEPVIDNVNNKLSAGDNAIGSSISKDNFRIFTTHKHWDHSGGNEEMAQTVKGLTIYGGAIDDVKGCTNALKDGDSFTFGSLRVEIMHTPCHTSGHVLYHVYHPEDRDNGALFTGDTLFVAGIGAFFEGNSQQMCKAMERVSALPDATAIYPGHEYTMNFLKFAADCEPASLGTNEVLNGWLLKAKDLRAQKLPTVPSSVKDERAMNPFMRAALSEEYRAALGKGQDPVVVMQHLYDTCP